MFWKKKKTVELEIDSRHEDNRAAYRIAPDKSNPVIISIDGNSFQALNISGTGVAFRSSGFAPGKCMRAMIRLASEDRVFPVILEVIAVQKDLCRCSFKEIHDDAENLLHSYILALQKRKIRQNHGQQQG